MYYTSPLFDCHSQIHFFFSKREYCKETNVKEDIIDHNSGTDSLALGPSEEALGSKGNQVRSAHFRYLVTSPSAIF